MGGLRRIAEREDKLFFALFARSSATPCRLFRVHRDRATRISVPRTPWGATVQTASSHSFAVRAFFLTCRAPLSRAFAYARVVRARVRHFSFFVFTASPLCRKPLSDSRFGVKAFPKMLHRGEASIPPPLLRATIGRAEPDPPAYGGGRESRKAPCKMPKNRRRCTKVPVRSGEGVGEGNFSKAFTPCGLSISVLMHGG